MKKTLLLAIFTLLISSGISHAQSVQSITLQDAIRIALENNYQLKQAENNLGLSEVSIQSEMADFLPSLTSSFGGSINQGRQQTFVEDQFRFVDVVSKGVSGSLNAGFTIFNGFQNLLTLKISQNDKESAEDQLQRAEETIIFTTATRFLQVLLDEQLLAIAQENLATSQKQLEQIQAQVEVGSRASVDAFNQESTVATNELTVTQRENTLQLNTLLLIRQLQIDPLGNYEFVTPQLTEANASTADPAAYNLQELIDEALRSRADYRSELTNIKNLNFQLKLARARLLPTLSASGSVSSGYSDQYRFGGQNVNFGDQFFDQRVNKSIGFSFQLPLFNNWNRIYNIEVSKVNLKNAELGIDNTRLQIIQEVTQAYTDYSSIVKQFEASNKAVIASEKAFETQQERYDVGASTLIELSQSQATYVTAQSNYTQALYNLVFQEKLLDFYLGKLSGDNVEF